MEETFKEKCNRLESRAKQLYVENADNKEVFDFIICHSGKMILRRYYEEYIQSLRRGETPKSYEAFPMDELKIYAVVSSQTDITSLEFKEISKLGMSYN